MKKVVVAWGRMNPVTTGHEKLAKKVTGLAKSMKAEPRIYLSHTQNAKKDPLQYNSKISYAQKSFGRMVKKSNSRTLIQLLQELERDGFTDLVFVAGSDRIPEYKKLINKYNGKDYNFDTVKVVSAGERDPDADDVSGMSASKMRQLASTGNQKEFVRGAPSGLSTRDKDKLYSDVRKGMMVEEYEHMLNESYSWNFNFTDEELDQEVSEYDYENENFDEELFEDDDLINERAPLSIVQRLKKARQMRRMAPRMKRMRAMRKFRMAPKERLKYRAQKQARNLIRKRVAGKLGAKYATLSASQKISVDRLVAKKSGRINSIATRLMPKVRKAEIERLKSARARKNESLENHERFTLTLFERKGVAQDSDIKDRPGAQPKKYYTGMSKSTKEKRDAQFKRQSKMSDDNPSAYKPAPGDAEGKTKPSKYTKKYKKMFGEAGPAVTAARERIKREKERKKIENDRLLDRARMQDTRAKNTKTNPTTESFDRQWLFNPRTNKKVYVTKILEYNKYTRLGWEPLDEILNETQIITEKQIAALRKKSEKSGISYGILKKVYDRGMAAWRTGHRPGTTPHQWAFARVNSYITKGKTYHTADKDLREEYGAGEEGTTKLTKKYKKDTPNEELRPAKRRNPVVKHMKTFNKSKTYADKKKDYKRKPKHKSKMYEVLDESLNVVTPSGIGTFLTASDHGIELQAGFSHHPEVKQEMLDQQMQEALRLGNASMAIRDLFNSNIGAKFFTMMMKNKTRDAMNIALRFYKNNPNYTGNAQGLAHEALDYMKKFKLGL